VLEKRYKDAKFLTVIRDPTKRIVSALNFLKAGPTIALAGNTPWQWLGEALARSVLEYNDAEMAFYARSGGNKIVLSFDAFVRDLEGTLRTVYARLFDEHTLPASVPRQHAKRKRHGYTLDRSLAECGVDEAHFRAQCAPYIEWCESLDK